MKKLLFLLLLALPAGCEILETDLSDERVTVIAPADGVAVPAGRVDFRWEATPHAAGYALTIVAPTFAAARRVAADTLLLADTMQRNAGCALNLPEGRYEWRVAAFNDSSVSSAEIRALTVLASETEAAP